MNKFLLQIEIEYWNGSFEKETIYANIYADENFFQVRNAVLAKWEKENPKKQIQDYTIVNHRQYNEWLKTQK